MSTKKRTNSCHGVAKESDAAAAEKRQKLEAKFYDEPDIEAIVTAVLSSSSAAANDTDGNMAADVRIADECGRLPHHYLASVLMDYEEHNDSDTNDFLMALERCYKVYPEGAKSPDLKNHLPLDLFVAGLLDRDSDGIQCMVDELLDDDTRNPLALLSVGKLMLSSYPSAVFSSGLFHMIANCFQSTEEDDAATVKQFREHQQQAVKSLMKLTFGDLTSSSSADETQDLPIHVVASHSWRKFSYLALPHVLTSPSMAKKTNALGKLPLHLAVAGSGTTFLGQGEKALYEQQSDEKSSRYTVSHELVKLLVDAFPEALTVKDQEGLTPLQIAERNQCEPAVLASLTPT